MPSYNLKLIDSKRQADATPHAASLIEGLRDFGYTLETAMADIIDNSITAGASKVEILAETSADKPWIAILDNGDGMTEDELIGAMRPGSRNPTEKRQGHDLGRFGLGLKCASFSQCRQLTVISKKENSISAATWDLDKVAATNEWNVDLEDDLSEFPVLENMAETGTVVLWRKLDRLSTNYLNDTAKRSAELNKALSNAEQHLRLCFHRFMEGQKPKLQLKLNGRVLLPIDPFASNHDATQRDPEERLSLLNGEVVTQCFTLPHHKKVTKDEWEELGGSKGHLRSQGFYIYRGNRLIIAGSWLGIARQKELTKLARVRVDIPNTMDADWKIDVKKASAQMPPLVRERLSKIVERLQGTSKRTYHARGRQLVSDEQLPLWNRVLKDGKIIYRPNIEHPSIEGVAAMLPEEFQNSFRASIALLGSGLPIAALHADMLGGAEKVDNDKNDFVELNEMAELAIRQLKKNGVKGSEAIDILCSTEPYMHHKEAMQSLARDIEIGSNS